MTTFTPSNASYYDRLMSERQLDPNVCFISLFKNGVIVSVTSFNNVTLTVNVTLTYQARYFSSDLRFKQKEVVFLRWFDNALKMSKIEEKRTLKKRKTATQAHTRYHMKP